MVIDRIDSSAAKEAQGSLAEVKAGLSGYPAWTGLGPEEVGKWQTVRPGHVVRLGHAAGPHRSCWWCYLLPGTRFRLVQRGDARTLSVYEVDGQLH